VTDKAKAVEHGRGMPRGGGVLMRRWRCRTHIHKHILSLRTIEREREKFIDNQEVTERRKHNALSGNTASGRTGSSI
jgi:hypothetical protein